MPHFTCLEKPLQLSITSIPKPLQWTSSMGILFLFFDKQTKKKIKWRCFLSVPGVGLLKILMQKKLLRSAVINPKKSIKQDKSCLQDLHISTVLPPLSYFHPRTTWFFFFQRPTLCRIWGSKSPGSHLQWPPRATWWHLGCERMKPLMGAGRIQGRIDQAGCGDKVIYFSSRLKPPPIKKQRSSFQDLKKKEKKKDLESQLQSMRAEDLSVTSPAEGTVAQ